MDVNTQAQMILAAINGKPKSIRPVDREISLSSHTRTNPNYNPNGVVEATAHVHDEIAQITEAKKAAGLQLVLSMQPNIQSRNRRFSAQLWHSNKGLTGEIEIEGDTYRLAFGDWGSLEHRMAPSQYLPVDQAWMNYWLPEALPDAFAASRGTARTSATRYAVSPLLNGTRWDNSVASPNAVVHAVWRNEQPIHLQLINGIHSHELALRPFEGRGGNSPNFKTR